jgi:hypothetical protein
VAVLDENLGEIVVHRRLFSQQRQEQMDWLPYLSQLSRRLTTLKYTPIYDILPDPL